jgi:hypothetical protein
MPPKTPNPNATEHERKDKKKFNFFSENWDVTPVHTRHELFTVRCATRELSECPLLGFLHYFLGLLLILSLGLLRIF